MGIKTKLREKTEEKKRRTKRERTNKINILCFLGK